MFIKKLVFKNRFESFAATLRSDEKVVINAPKDAVPIAAEIDGKTLVFDDNDGVFSIPIRITKETRFAALFRRNGEWFFGAENLSDQALSKWRLLEFAKKFQTEKSKETSLTCITKEESENSSTNNEKKLMEAFSAEKDGSEINPIDKTVNDSDPINDESESKQKGKHSEFSIEAESQREPYSTDSPMIPTESDPAPIALPTSEIEKVRALIENGEPFPFLEEAIAGSRWTKLEEDGTPYYLGILSAENEEKILYAIAGSRNAPEIENAAFFPSPNDEEIGWFIQELDT